MHRSVLGAALAIASLAAAVPIVSEPEAQPGEGKKKRLPKPKQIFEQQPLTRQQRRYAERQAMKGQSQ